MNEDLIVGADLLEDDDDADGAVVVDVLDGIGLDPAEDDDEDDFENPGAGGETEEDEKGWGMD